MFTFLFLRKSWLQESSQVEAGVISYIPVVAFTQKKRTALGLTLDRASRPAGGCPYVERDQVLALHGDRGGETRNASLYQSHGSPQRLSEPTIATEFLGPTYHGDCRFLVLVLEPTGNIFHFLLERIVTLTCRV